MDFTARNVVTRPTRFTSAQKIVRQSATIPVRGLVRKLSEIIEICTTPNRKDTFRHAFEIIKRNGTKNLIETGCYRGTFADGCSTVVLAAMAREVGGKVDSYELAPRNISVARSALQKFGLHQFVEFHQGDSITNLARRTKPVGFAYLDSFDCGTLNMRPAQEHCLGELEAILPLMEQKASVLIDDHMEVRGGKTKLAMRRLWQRGFTNFSYGYQLLFAHDNTAKLPKTKFAVICGHGDLFVPLAKDTIYKNKAIYCTLHGYDLRIERSIRSKFTDPKTHAGGFSWSRLEAMLDLVKSGAYQWVWCVGADTLITNFKITLESIVADAQDSKHVLICGERVAPLQADSFLVRCSPEGIAWLEELLSQYPAYKHHPWVENQTMIDLREKHANVTQIVPQWKLNSYQYDLYYSFNNDAANYRSGLDCYGNRGQWQEKDFLVHWPGTTLQKRLELVKQYTPKIIKPSMNVVVIYTRILGKGTDAAPPPEYYAACTERFLKTYTEFKPEAEHKLIVVNCNPGKPDSMFDGVCDSYMNYMGHGWDCGTYQFAALALNCDLVVGCNAFSYFWRKGWLEPIIKAAEHYGPGVYGPTASYENHPHIRTPCIAFHPGMASEYPHFTNSRETCVQFESGPNNFTLWANRAGYPTMMVTEHEVLPMEDWRKPPNIFRRGDQSNCLVWDRHTKIYAEADSVEKARLEKSANGK